MPSRSYGQIVPIPFPTQSELSPLFDEQEAEYDHLRERQERHELHHRQLTLDARSIIPFCDTALTTGFDIRAKLLTSLTVFFDKPEGSQYVWPKPMNTVIVNDTLGVLTSLRDLTITGLEPRNDGWILDSCGALLERFCTDLWSLSKEMVSFLKKQTHLTSLIFIPKYRPQTKSNMYALLYRVDSTFLRALRTLRCGGGFLLFLERSRPKGMPPVRNLRVDLFATDRLLHTRILNALSLFGDTLKSLSLRFEAPAYSTRHVDDTICKFAEGSESWARLKFLEVRGMMYSRQAEKDFLHAIFRHFPRLRVLIWVPAYFAPDGHRLHPARVASQFLLRCQKLRRFVFVGPEVQDIMPPKYASYMKLKEDDLYVEGRLKRFETTWQDGAVFFDHSERGAEEEEESQGREGQLQDRHEG
ncbi:hypothetical protein EUX98_g1253 [Antrodiella citrinella]|uniref:Uncharacterized protein n=1 Tax=Antrodiella citrinella TaxID=2447956 RepID=A0A4S4N203_9APHY|nr:hypothetical protein EUX98_g1253 [Antrodiella citrinella]